MPLVQQCSTRNAETTYHAAAPAADPAARVKNTYSVGVFVDTLLKFNVSHSIKQHQVQSAETAVELDPEVQSRETDPR